MAAFYLDNDVSADIAELLRQAGHDATTARSIGLKAVTDAEQLLRAAEERWVLVVHNREDYVLLQDAWLRWSAAWRISPEHAGILVIPQPSVLPPAQAARELSDFVRSGRPLVDQLYIRHPRARPNTWDRWRPGRGASPRR